MPGWWAKYLEAQRLSLSIPELEAWCWHGSGSYYLPRLRVGWRIEAAAEAQRLREMQQRAQDPETFGGHGQIRWLGGGECDPHDSAIFEDEQDMGAA